MAVRGGPVLNDATVDDALRIGLDADAEIIGNGSDAPGAVLELCSPEFRRRFDEADLVIAKGQGNYEALGEVPGNLVFLFRVKCPVIARHAGHPVGTNLVLDRTYIGA